MKLFTAKTVLLPCDSVPDCKLSGSTFNVISYDNEGCQSKHEIHINMTKLTKWHEPPADSDQPGLEVYPGV